MARRRSSLAVAAASENRLRFLQELRARLVAAIEEVTCVRDLEPLVRRADVVSQEIDDILALQPSGSPADVIAARRAQRRAAGQVVAIDHSVDRGTKLHG
jgi:hypothetical protein